MIGYIKGKLVYFEDGVVILETGGVGYEINCSASVYKKLTGEGGGEAYIYTAVKEDEISLFGFISAKEKKMFLNLISVNGVGPKLGITVLSYMDVEELAAKIVTEDVKGLSKVKGLGKKTAERIILELKEKISQTGVDLSAATPIEQDEEEEDDALSALLGLGFSKTESIAALKQAKALGAVTVQQKIALALKSMR